MKDVEIENVEIELLLEAVAKRYGYDFRGYARASVERRIRGFLPRSGCATVSEMIPRLLRDETFFGSLLREFSITVSEFFRDPWTYKALREKVVPVLKTYPFIRVWVAGCAGGEEAYSLAILLEEEGLAEKTTIFATDFNDTVLEAAAEGVYRLDHVKQFTENYQRAGGLRSLSEYYHAKYDAIKVSEALRKRVTFANHNLAVDGVFGEMQLILCRNVLIYFGRQLQDRALGLFDKSLVPGGFLCLGGKESIISWEGKEHFRTIDETGRIFQKKRGVEADGETQ